MNRFFPILFFFLLTSFSTVLKGQLGFQVNNATGQFEDTITVDVRATGFKDVLTMQFGLQWDTSYLKFVDITNFGLPNLDKRSFGYPGIGIASAGQLIVLWLTEDLVAPVDLPDDSILFSIQLLVTTKLPVSTKVNFSRDVSTIEVINSEVNSIPIASLTDGTINLNDSGSPDGFPQISLDSLRQPTCDENEGLIFVSVNGGPLPHKYEWSGPANFSDTTLNLDRLIPGEYRLQVTDAANQVVSATFELINPNLFSSIIFLSDCTLDNQGHVSMTGIVNTRGPRDLVKIQRYEWSTGEINITSRDRSTTYLPLDTLSFLTVFDDQGCQLTSGPISPLDYCDNLPVDTTDLFIPDTMVLFTSDKITRFIGDTVIVPVSVDRINDLEQIALSYEWDTLAVDLIGYTTNSQFSNPLISIRSRSFLFSIFQAEGIEIPDSTVLFNMVFKTKNFDTTTSINFRKGSFGTKPNRDSVWITAQDITISYGVWPGDTDLNGIVDQFDLFNLGNGFGSQGPARDQANTQWQPNGGQNWKDSTPNSKINYRFVDTDGNGQIDKDDVQVILQNYGQSHPGKTLPNDFIEPRSQNTMLNIALDTLVAGNAASFPIRLGSAVNPVSDIYSIGFSIAYDAPFFEENSLQLDLSDSWLADTPEGLIAIVKAVPEAKRMDVAISRIDGQDISGYGEIARIDLNALEQIPFAGTESTLALDLTGVRAQDVGENPFSIANSTTMVEVMASSRVQTIPATWFSLFPVPAQDILNLSSNQNLAIQVLQILDSQGRVLNRISYSNQGIQQTIDVSAYATGTYLLQIFTEEGFAVKKFLIQRD